MNSHQRRKAIRAGTHARCDNCGRVRRWPPWRAALTGCEICWGYRMQRAGHWPTPRTIAVHPREWRELRDLGVIDEQGRFK